MNKNKKIRILGKGLTAYSLKNIFKKAILYDEGNYNTYDMNSNKTTIVSPGISPSNHMVKKAKNLKSDYDLFAKQMPFSIWVSGTNGKTTTCEMLQHILKKYKSVCGGNNGVPISKLNIKAKIWILETSSFTLHYTNKAVPNLYILLPISEDHISWHGSFEEYEKSKLKPLYSMKKGEVAIIPKKYKNINSNAYIIFYDNSDDLCNIFNIEKNNINFEEPFLLDAILALCAKKILFDYIDYTKINTFMLSEHKLETIYDNKKRLWINDSKATNVDATIKALIPYMKNRIHIILGGDDKGANLIPLFEVLQNLEIIIYTIGSNYKYLISLSKKYNISYIKSKTLVQSVKDISLNYNKNSIAILSPAASSLDQFKSYAHRGEEFKKLVYNLSFI